MASRHASSSRRLSSHSQICWAKASQGGVQPPKNPVSTKQSANRERERDIERLTSGPPHLRSPDPKHKSRNTY
jgi:hypothetical protein